MRQVKVSDIVKNLSDLPFELLSHGKVVCVCAVPEKPKKPEKAVKFKKLKR